MSSGHSILGRSVTWGMGHNVLGHSVSGACCLGAYRLSIHFSVFRLKLIKLMTFCLCELLKVVKIKYFYFSPFLAPLLRYDQILVLKSTIEKFSFCSRLELFSQSVSLTQYVVSVHPPVSPSVPVSFKDFPHCRQSSYDIALLHLTAPMDF